MSTVNFTTTEKFQVKLAKLAADHKLEFSTEDVETLTRRLENAYNAISGALAARGLTQVQISTWVRGEEFQLDIATFWYAKDSGWGGTQYDEKDWTKVFNREPELATIAILNNDGDLLTRGTGTVASGMDLLAINESLGDYS